MVYGGWETKRGRGHFLREMFRPLAVGFPPPEILPQDNLHPSGSSLSFFLYLYLSLPFSHRPLSLRETRSCSPWSTPRSLRHPPRTTLPLVTLTPEKWAGGAAKTWRGQWRVCTQENSSYLYAPCCHGIDIAREFSRRARCRMRNRRRRRRRRRRNGKRILFFRVFRARRWRCTFRDFCCAKWCRKFEKMFTFELVRLSRLDIYVHWILSE